MIGVRLYGLREEMVQEQRLVLQALHDMGISAVEPFISPGYRVDCQNLVRGGTERFSAADHP